MTFLLDPLPGLANRVPPAVLLRQVEGLQLPGRLAADADVAAAVVAAADVAVVVDVDDD